MDLTLPSRRVAAAVLAVALAVASVVTASPAQAQESTAEIDRIGGANRIETAIGVSQAAFETADAVVIARPGGYADALSGGPLAAALGAPILLADDVADLEAGVSAEIDRLGAGTVYVIGGEAAVSPDVVDALDDGREVTRLAGPTRFETAQEVARALESVADVSTGVIVKGVDAADAQQGFADALSAAWWAGQQGYAILPVRTDAVPEGHVDVMQEIGVTSAYVVGGAAAVSEDVVTTVTEAGVDLTARLAGADRYETSAIVWSTAVAQGADPTERWVARGDVFPDALASGPAVAGAGYSFVLVHPTDLDRSEATATVLANTPEQLDRIVVLGGEDAVEPSVADQIGAVTTDRLGDAAYCLTVLHNNDGESQLIASASGEPLGGVARFVSVVERERQLAQAGVQGDGCTERASITLNSGDNFLAGAEFEASQQSGFATFYDAVALGAVGYDAFAVGNHEFDFGPEVLDAFVNAVPGDTPFVSANLVVQGTVLEGDIQPSALITKGSRQIGVIGASPTNLAQISSPGDVGVLDFEATVDAVNAEAQSLREQGADVVVLQSHLQNIDQDIELVSRTTDVDIAIAGGGGELLGEYGNLYLPDQGAMQLPASFGADDAPLVGTYPLRAADADGDVIPIVTTTGDYEYLGRLRARFDADGFASPQYDPRRSRLVRVVDEDYAVDGVVPDPQVQADVVDPVSQFVEGFEAQVIGQNQVGLNALRADVRTEQTNVGALLTDSYVYAVEQSDAGLDTTVPTVAIANGGGIRADAIIEPGDFTVGEAIAIAPFTNTVVAFGGVTADQLLPLLERGVSGLPDAEGRFSQVGGLEIVVDTSQTAQVVGDDGEIVTEGHRVRSVTLSETGTELVSNGEVVDTATTFNLATVNFTAEGGDNYPFAAVGLTPDEYVQVSPLYRRALQTYVEEGLAGTITAAQYPLEFDERITFAGG